jgi:hypothetical protein
MNPITQQKTPLLYSFDQAQAACFKETGKRLESHTVSEPELAQMAREMKACGQLPVALMRVSDMSLVRFILEHGVTYRGVPVKIASLLVK